MNTLDEKENNNNASPVGATSNYPTPSRTSSHNQTPPFQLYNSADDPQSNSSSSPGRIPHKRDSSDEYNELQNLRREESNSGLLRFENSEEEMENEHLLESGPPIFHRGKVIRIGCFKNLEKKKKKQGNRACI
jgi:hypothetical protein